MKLKEYSSYLIAFCATIVRYYDYALFGLSASIISKNFMPTGNNDGDQMLIFFAIFSIAVAARPLGSLFFGKIGDMVGRVTSVKLAAAIAVISTSLIAIIPSFDSIGWLAVILLTICRMLFLMSLAGEIDAIKIYVAEKIGSKKRHFAAGIVSFSSQIGVLFASIMHHVTISMEEITWLWKANFLLGGAMGVLILMMRDYFQESQEFLNSKATSTSEALSSNIITIIGNDKLKFIIATMINGMLGGGYHFLVIFLGNFAANVTNVISPHQASSGNIILISLYGIGCLVSGYIADKVKMIVQTTTALMCSIICILIMEFILQANIFAWPIHYMLAFLTPFYMIPCTIKAQSLFATRVRMRMFSLSHSIGSMLFSSTTPFICMLLWRWTELFTVVLAYFLLQLTILLLALLYIAKQDYKSMFET